MTSLPPAPPKVATAFAAFPPETQALLDRLRGLIFATAAETPGVGPLTETLKWGEPAYLTEATGSGSTVRLGVLRDRPTRCAVFVNCKTDLVATFRSLFAGELTFEGDRALILDPASPPPHELVAQRVALALTYHQRKRRASARAA
jgi:hypothetical protein